jgi:quinoprotein glucose dehydrogenase
VIRKGLILAAFTVAIVLFAVPVQRPFDTWRQYLGGTDSAQYSSLKQIDKTNVSKLQVAWTYPTNATRFNPIVVDGTMYVAANNRVVALDGATGKEIWARPGGAPARGINYWESKDRSDRRLVLIAGGLTEVNALTGETITTFGTEGRVSIGPGLDADDRTTASATANPGRVISDVIVIPLPAGGASYEAIPGDIHGYDVKTGKLLWVFHTIPRPGEYGYDTWPPDLWKSAGGVHNWSEMSGDEERGIAYIPLGTARFDFYGGNRPGNNLFGNSLLALDVKTGKRLWHFQTVHHDMWDYDLPTAPKLLTVQHNGRAVDAIAQPTKQGFLFVFDRVTGDPLWPVEERRVPQSDVPGEKSSPTQPFPTLPPPFARQSFTEKDINPFLTDAEKDCIRDMLRNSRNEGLFTPPSLKGTIQMPGNNGGANWGSSGVDPRKGTMYVVSKELPMGIKLNAPGSNGTVSAPCAAIARGAAGGGAGAAGGGGAGGGRGGGGRGAGRGAPPAAAGAAPEAGAAAGAGQPGGPGGDGRGAGAGAGGGGRGGRGGAPVPQNTGDLTRYGQSYDFMSGTSLQTSMIGPPWSQLTAYDLNTGKILWQVPNGSVPGLAPGTGSHFPRGGVLVTGGALVFVATSSDRKVRAYDQENGKVIWEYELPNVSEGVPMAYQIDGREYIAFCVGGGAQGPQPGARGLPQAAPGAYMVFALPR